ncbi:MAG: hypothetical protein KY455_13230 [Euryarchaeota archaeon]|nr:hypothetical protein [Euryarchaeota archaeon]
MMQKRMLLAFFVSFLMFPLAGCVGEDKAEPSAPGTISDSGQGIPTNAKITLDPVKLAPTATIERYTQKSMSFNESLPPIPHVNEERTKFGLTWTIDELIPLGESEAVGEVFYQAWLGTENNGEVSWERTGEQHSAPNGSFGGGKAPSRGNWQYTHLMITLEARNDGFQEIPIVVVEGMKDREGTWTGAGLDPFATSGGTVKPGESSGGKVNLTVTALNLPETDNGVYDVFLRSGDENTRLGTLKIDPSLGAFAVRASVEESKLNDWSVFVTYEPKQEENDEPSMMKVMKSQFRS